MALPEARTRRFPRIPYERPVKVKLLAERQRLEQRSKIQVLGAGGCMFVSRHSLGFNSLMELVIGLDQRPISTDARVVYEIPRGETVEVGVEFLRISPRDRALISALVAREQGRPAGSHPG